MAWKNQPSDFFGRADLDHAAGVPIGVAEQVRRLLDAIDHVGEDAAVPAAGIAGAADAGDGVPARGRRSPRASSGVAPISAMSRSPRAGGLGGGEIVDRPRHKRSGRQHRRQHFAGVRT